ncbi:threonine synthase [Limosilactobacillus equigenerosi]|uniref:Threonine synthase n=1 Tax=Limosilactobacillus equigenerosi DSM 18793 = JCM 14505 TaxID=1423742 RepID=A0A0R1UU46_9LACO|nr:threonine synthase [Limosilactobacillus equigenerosi]KRL94995.1 threonine synthase [Limosilactobacillus equigenerosi DSM 18793 = JCM 14505]
MQYRSTRGNIKNTLNSAQAVIQGLAPDGGLYVPVAFPHPDVDLAQLSNLSYQELAQVILSWFFDDFTDEQLTTIVNQAYGDQWEDDAIAPVSAQHDGNYYLELFHGPTLAFKDIALQVLPRLMTKAVTLEHVGKDIIILTATSGDTGSASMHGFSDQANTQVIVFYPAGGVSPVQLKQMLSLRGQNLTAIAIEGNFDDAQTKVKEIFNNHDFGHRLAVNGYQFSSANSMNIGRLIPQIVYYFAAYGQLVQRHAITVGDQVNFAVPTGNFGDILAGYYAQQLGLPIKHLICASNKNNVLTDFFKTGTYDRQRPFYLTNAPAMDILVSSNLERLLFDYYQGDADAVTELMDHLTQSGHYTVTAEVHDQLAQTFPAGFATEAEVRAEIKRLYDQTGYLIDPHTAVASHVTHQYQQATNDQTPTVIIATASPAKFPETVLTALNGQAPTTTGLAAIQTLFDQLGQPLSPNVQSLFDQTPRPEQTIATNEMEAKIAQLLKLDD